tara:strand:- start:1154 stop:1549 length:396 start_codon:yes stop_codon:yes gene_type:complete
MKNSHLRKLNNMRKRPIKLKESDIMNIVKRVIRERENIPYPETDTPGPPENPGRPDRGPKRPTRKPTSELESQAHCVETNYPDEYEAMVDKFIDQGGRPEDIENRWASWLFFIDKMIINPYSYGGGSIIEC